MIIYCTIIFNITYVSTDGTSGFFLHKLREKNLNLHENVGSNVRSCGVSKKTRHVKPVHV